MSILKGTMVKSPALVETGNTGKDLDVNISSLSSQYQPGSIADFSEATREIANLAYQTRQTAEHAQLGRQFDPTKVSGGTFADIMGFVEKHRGADIGKIASASVHARMESQRQIGSTLESLKADRTRLKSDARAFKFEMASKYPGVYNNLSADEKDSIENGDPSMTVFAKFDAYAEEAKRKEDAWEAEKRAMTRASYSKTTVSNAQEKEMNAFFLESARSMENDTEADGGKGQDGWVSQQTTDDWMQWGIQKFGKAYEQYASTYSNFVAPGQTDAEITRAKEQEERDLLSKELVSSAKSSYYDKGEGLWDLKEEDVILWDEFIKAYPQVAKDPRLAMDIKTELERAGKTIR